MYIGIQMEKVKRTKIADLLSRTDYGTMVNVKGWVRTRRGSKQVNFVAINDGSTIKNVQIVVDVEHFNETVLKEITTGACVSVNGILTESIGAGQTAEIQAREIEILGTCDNTYPLQKKGHSMEFLREIAHLRPRTNTFGAIFRIRHKFLSERHIRCSKNCYGSFVGASTVIKGRAIYIIIYKHIYRIWLSHIFKTCYMCKFSQFKAVIICYLIAVNKDN